MASEDMGLVQAQQRLENGLNHPQLVFQDNFSCGPPPQRRTAVSPIPDPGASKATTRELTGGFIDHHQHHHYFHQPTPTDFRRAMFSSSASAAASSDCARQDNCHNWTAKTRASTTPSGDGSEDDDVDDDDEDDDDNDDENEVEGLALVSVDNNNAINCDNKINSSNNNNSSDKIGNQKSKHLPPFGKS